MVKTTSETARQWFTGELGKEVRYPEISKSVKERYAKDESVGNNVLVPVEQDDGSISFEEPEEPEVTVKVETDVDFGKREIREHTILLYYVITPCCNKQDFLLIFIFLTIHTKKYQKFINTYVIHDFCVLLCLKD